MCQIFKIQVNAAVDQNISESTENAASRNFKRSVHQNHKHIKKSNVTNSVLKTEIKFNPPHLYVKSTKSAQHYTSEVS